MGLLRALATSALSARGRHLDRLLAGANSRAADSSHLLGQLEAADGGDVVQRLLAAYLRDAAEGGLGKESARASALTRKLRQNDEWLDRWGEL